MPGGWRMSKPLLHGPILRLIDRSVMRMFLENVFPLSVEYV